MYSKLSDVILLSFCEFVFFSAFFLNILQHWEYCKNKKNTGVDKNSGCIKCTAGHVPFLTHIFCIAGGSMVSGHGKQNC